MDMNIQKHLAFVKTAEYGSFTKAAELLNYSQSGISRMIGDLEAEWGVVLLERGKGGVRLTGDGIKLLPFAKSVVNEYEKLTDQVHALNGLRSGHISIATFSSAATHWLPGIIRAFRGDYPNVDYEIFVGDYAEVEDLILTGRADCGFLRFPVHPDLETHFLEQDKLLAVLPEGHPLAALDRVPVAALAAEPFMLYQKGEKGEISGIFERTGITPNVKFTTCDDYAAMAMVESGMCVSILPELILERVPYRIVAKQLDVPAYRNMVFVLRDMKTASLAVRKFYDYLHFRQGGSHADGESKL